MVPVRIRTLFFGICIKKKVVFITVNAKNSRRAVLKAISMIRGKFNDERQMAEIMSPILDIDFMAMLGEANKTKKPGFISRLANILFGR